MSDTRPADDLAVDRLGPWMADHVAGFAGGQSNPTYRIDTPTAAWVLRRKPFGPLLPRAHANIGGSRRCTRPAFPWPNRSGCARIQR